MNWFQLAQDKVISGLVNMAINFRVPWEVGNFMSSFHKITLLQGGGWFGWVALGSLVRWLAGRLVGCLIS
jgi:hypothetical protein